MSIFAAFIAALHFWLAGPAPADVHSLRVAAEKPGVQATVSLSEQRMYVTVIDTMGIKKTITWKVSTGRAGFDTPTGEWTPTWLSIDHRSKTYDDAPMPFAVFFTGGYAVHATEAVRRLGEPASHGCVRLSPENAAVFFKLVESYGKRHTRIIITA